MNIISEASSSTIPETPNVATADMKLKVILIPVSDVDRAKEFYAKLGWRLDADRSPAMPFVSSSSRHPGLEFRFSLA